MVDYEALVEALRLEVECDKRIYPQLPSKDILISAAADAIEALQKVANKLIAKYQEEATGMIWEYSGCIDESLDYLNKEIRTLQAQIDGKI